MADLPAKTEIGVPPARSVLEESFHECGGIVALASAWRLRAIISEGGEAPIRVMTPAGPIPIRSRIIESISRRPQRIAQPRGSGARDVRRKIDSAKSNRKIMPASAPTLRGVAPFLNVRRKVLRGQRASMLPDALCPPGQINQPPEMEYVAERENLGRERLKEYKARWRKLWRRRSPTMSRRNLSR